MNGPRPDRRLESGTQTRSSARKLTHTSGCAFASNLERKRMPERAQLLRIREQCPTQAAARCCAFPSNPERKRVPRARQRLRFRKQTRTQAAAGSTPAAAPSQSRTQAAAGVTPVAASGLMAADRRAAGWWGAPGVSPRADTASRRRGGKKPPSIERRRVATGANHPASHSSALRRGPGTPAIGAPAGDQSTGKNVTPNIPLVRQDRITR
jgi:hypothetical protein